jgi:phospholipid-binding lipoprotein MlaA
VRNPALGGVFMMKEKKFMKHLSIIVAGLVVMSIGFFPWAAYASPDVSTIEVFGEIEVMEASYGGYLLSQNETAEQASPAEDEDATEATDATEEEDMDFLDEDMDFSDEEGGSEMLTVADFRPIYWWNKGMFHFNDKFYWWIARPAARGYGWLVPEVVRRGVNNFFFNLSFPIRFVNCILQGKGNDVGMEAGRFIVNTTVGVLGFRNAAKNYPELNPPVEDTGQTLGKWGIGNGFYIIWPFLGPSTLRDTVGLVGDYFLYPITWWANRPKWWWAITVYDKFNEFSLNVDQYKSLTEGAIDPYVSIRDAYIQHRHKKVNE